MAEPPTSRSHAHEHLSERLRYAQETYREVLDATKHQDDKIGRFLTGIAFLIAGALVFTSPEVLQARYAVGSLHLRLPAMALTVFLVLVVLSVLLYVLAMAAPLTIPSPSSARRSRDQSHLFFLMIARETRDSWDSLWASARLDELRRDLVDEYLSEARNIAQRVDEKYERANEASALFVVALLFFLLAIVFSVDVLQHARPPTGQTLQVPSDLTWGAPLRATVAIILAMFAAILVYFRLRAAQTRRIGELADVRRERDLGSYALHILFTGYPLFVLALLLPGGGSGAFREIAEALAVVAALGVGLAWHRLVLSRPKDPVQAAAGRLGRKMIIWSILAVSAAVAVASWLAVHHVWPEWQLALALGAAISPLAPNAWESSRKLHERLQWHRQFAGSAASIPGRAGQASGDGSSAEQVADM